MRGKRVKGKAKSHRKHTHIYVCMRVCVLIAVMKLSAKNPSIVGMQQFTCISPMTNYAEV